jgi:hypothetical protein
VLATIGLSVVVVIIIAFTVANRGLGLIKTLRGETPLGRFYQRIGLLTPREGRPRPRRFWPLYVLIFGAGVVVGLAAHNYVAAAIFAAALVLGPLLSDPRDPRRWRWQRRSSGDE